MSEDKNPSMETHVVGMNREIMGKIVDEVFDGAIEVISTPEMKP